MSRYLQMLPETLRLPEKPTNFRALDLFAGCGGLSLGFEVAGIPTLGYECVSSAVATYNANLNGHCIEQKLQVGDAFPEADLLVGGPPCQPFSVRGKQKGIKDARDGFPIFIDAVKRIAPSCVNPRDLYPDRAARALTCRNLAGATSDMQRVRLEGGWWCGRRPGCSPSRIGSPFTEQKLSNFTR